MASFLLRLALLLAALDLRLVALLALPHEVPQHSYLIVVVFVEVEAIAVAVSDLEEVIV